MSVKFPLLYGAGYFFLGKEDLSVAALLSGISLLYGIMFVEALVKVVRRGIVFVLPFFVISGLEGSLDSDVPEVPGLFTLLSKIFPDSFFALFLHQWETIIFSVLIGITICFVFWFSTRKKEIIPSGLQNFAECIVENLRNFILEVLGPSGEKFVPLLGTLFIYILAMNWVALIPLVKPPTSNLNVTIALALCVFFLVQYLNIKNWGVLGFIYHMAGSPKDTMGWALAPLMFPIELLTQFTRPLTLAFRLFGNVVGEDILIGAAALFGVYLVSIFADVVAGFPMQVPFMFLAVLTGLMQALVFTLLSTIYILLSMPDEEEPSSDNG